MGMDDERLIKLVRRYAELYNPNHRKYMDIEHKKKVWDRIGRELKQEAEECKKRWSNIRDNLRRSLRKRQIQQAKGSKRSQVYRFERQLRFLTESCDADWAANNDPATIIKKENTSEDENLLRDDEYAVATGAEPQATLEFEEAKTDDEESPTYYVPPSPKCIRPARKAKRVVPGRTLKNRPETASSFLMKYILESKKETANQRPDPIDTFLSGIASTLKGLNPYFQNIAKTKIFEVAQSLEMEQIVQNQQSTSPASVRSETSGYSLQSLEIYEHPVEPVECKPVQEIAASLEMEEIIQNEQTTSPVK